MNADYNKAQEAALELLDKLGYSRPPVNPVEIADELGMSVYDLTPKKDEEKIISGFFYQNNIYVNATEPDFRKTFTIAHELGHKILHQDWLESSNYEVLYRNTYITTQDPKEQEANWFASNLLVPEFMLR